MVRVYWAKLYTLLFLLRHFDMYWQNVILMCYWSVCSNNVDKCALVIESSESCYLGSLSLSFFFNQLLYSSKWFVLREMGLKYFFLLAYIYVCTLKASNVSTIWYGVYHIVWRPSCFVLTVCILMWTYWSILSPNIDKRQVSVLNANQNRTAKHVLNVWRIVWYFLPLK